MNDSIAKKPPSGEPEGWTKIRVRNVHRKIIRMIAGELLHSGQEHGARIPVQFIDAESVPANYVVVRALVELVSHRIRSTRGETRQRWLEIWRLIVEEAKWRPPSSGDSAVA